MAHGDIGSAGIILGDPVPWFRAPLLAGGEFNLQAAAGRWIVLVFLGSSGTPQLREELANLLEAASPFNEDQLVFCGVLAARPSDPEPYLRLGGSAISILLDEDGAISRAFGAGEVPHTIVLDPMLRAIANIPRDHPAGHAATVVRLVKGLPTVDDSAGVPLTAPALIVPRVFDFELCDVLMRFYDEMGGRDSGFLLDIDGKTATVIDHRRKRRSDLAVAHPQLRDAVRNRVVRRLLPAIDMYFQFQATRMDRYLVACYDSETGGHFDRHRDNVNAGAQHRRFAVSINLNKDYDGCDLVFPEFGRRLYRAPHGGAIVFSCGALHQVAPVTRGRRYAFLAFLYNEADAARRGINNTRLHEGEFIRRHLGSTLPDLPRTSCENQIRKTLHGRYPR